MRTIELPSTDELRALFSYDPIQGILHWKSRHKGRRDRVGWVQKNGYLMVTTKPWKPRKYLVHRIIWAIVYGDCSPALEIDHANRNPSDNRLLNLRAADRTLNNGNSKKRLHHIANLPKGVHMCKTRYRAQIRFRGQRYHLGVFGTAEEAHAAYMTKARELFGQFARAA